MSETGGDPACWAHVVDDRLIGSFDDEAWSLPHGGGLDANVVRLAPGGSIGTHVNDAVDVLLVVWSGSGEVVIDERRTPLESGTIVLVPRHASRSIVARGDGLVYLSTHPARGPMTIGPPPGSDR